MKFEQQLEASINEPWRRYYLNYGKMKRILYRLQLFKDDGSTEGGNALNTSANASFVGWSHSYGSINESSRLVGGKDKSHKLKVAGNPSGSGSVEMHSLGGTQITFAQVQRKLKAEKERCGYTINEATGKLTKCLPGEKSVDGSGVRGRALSIEDVSPRDRDGGDTQDRDGISATIDDENALFFTLVAEEIHKINQFFLGKLAVLRLELQGLAETLQDTLMQHHSSGLAAAGYAKLRKLYVDILLLRQYSEINQTGFYKILKKHDKQLWNEDSMTVAAMPIWMRVVEKQPFAVGGDSEIAQLLSQIQGLVSREKLLELEQYALENHKNSHDNVFPSVRGHGLAASVGVLALLLALPDEGLIHGDHCASRCAVLLAFTICMWVTEAIPYFATAILVLPMSVMLGCFKDPLNPSRPMPSPDAANLVMNSVFNHTSMLLLGGFSISAAISRCQVELRIAALLQRHMGSNPRGFILAIMLFSLFLAIWIANHAAPILCSTIIMPIVKDLPSSSRFCKALLLGVAFACNFGGMLTPISSLQNVLACTQLASIGIEISYGRWILVCVPFAIVCTVLCWLLIMAVFNPDDVSEIPEVVYEIQTTGQRKSLAMLVLSICCVIMFATSSETSEVFGDIGIISLLFISIFYGTGLLTEADFSSLSWSTLLLVGGGNVLGKAIDLSGLLLHLAKLILTVLPVAYPWLALLCILFLVVVVATFISHTVAAIILLPIVSKMAVTIGLPEHVVMGSAMAISAAMALPFSSFPNVNTLRIKDDFQTSYLTTLDFLKVGLPMSILTVLLISTLGLALIQVFEPGTYNDQFISPTAVIPVLPLGHNRGGHLY